MASDGSEGRPTTNPLNRADWLPTRLADCGKCRDWQLAAPGAVVMNPAADIFPLLASTPGALLHQGTPYPRRYTSLDGTTAPLFSSGIVPAAEITQIARRAAETIVRQYAGQHLLVVLVLEGARLFGEMVLGHIDLFANDGRFRYTPATIQVRSYGHGSQASAHQIRQPLHCRDGRELRDVAPFDAIVLLEDLIDGGETLAWLLCEYWPRLTAKQVRACTMLQKDRQRDSRIDRALTGASLLSTGKLVPDEWLVGYGLDMAVPGAAGEPALHLFRQALPGGIYAFNRAIEQILLADYQAAPQHVRQQLAVYMSSR